MASSSAGVPQRTLPEYHTEAALTGQRILVVEGPQDVKFFGDILLTMETNISVVPVDAVEPPEGGFELIREVDGQFIQLGNRDRVIQLARHEGGDGGSLRFLIDLDLDLPDELVQDLPNLLYTDYPAMESYWVSDRGLRWFVRTFDIIDRPRTGGLEFRRKMEDSTTAALLESLAKFLVILFCLRRAHRAAGSTAEFPSNLGKFRKGRGFPDAEPDTRKLARALGLDDETCRDVQIPEITLDEVRKVAYGHDIAATLWAVFPTLRNDHGIQTSRHLERLLLSQVASEDVREHGLFIGLAEWSGSCS